jgi:osmotically-inducible protein OsmY
MAMTEQKVLAAVEAELRRLGVARAVRATAAHDGVVTLTGAVADEAQRRVVVQEILRLDEVADVRDALRTPPPDGDLPHQLRALLEREGVNAADLAIEAQGEVITLSGKAQSWFDRDAAERLAWTLPGVRRVVDRVTLPPGAVDPEVEPGVPDPPN